MVMFCRFHAADFAPLPDLPDQTLSHPRAFNLSGPLTIRPSMQADADQPPMLRLMARDSGARQSLFQMLSVTDLAALLATGRSWSGWICAEPSVGKNWVRLKGRWLERFAGCQWIHRSVQHLRFHCVPSHDFNDFLRLMPRLTRLRWLWWFSCSVNPNPQLFRESLTAVSGTLQQLTADLGDSMQALWPALSVLTGLVYLCVDVPGPRADLDFSFLPALTRLDRLDVYCSADRDEFRPCSDEQIEALSHCIALTDLACGQWLASKEINDRAQNTLVNNRFATLVRRRKENGAMPLRCLDLGGEPVIDWFAWQSLSQLTELKSIEAFWSPALTADDWRKLARFQQLESLTVKALFDWNDPQAAIPQTDLSHVLSPLQDCGALHSLTLAGEFDLCAEHVMLLAQLPALGQFQGRRLRIETLAPLSAASANLTELDFSYCTGVGGDPINIRAMMPPMPFVSRLTLCDHRSSRMTAAAAEPFNIALLQRLPRLSSRRFSQGELLPA